MSDQAAGLRLLVQERQRLEARLARVVVSPAAASAPAAAAPKARRARRVAVTSGKGGVGKSNISVSIAIEAARAGMNVVLVDADHGLGNIDILCGVSATRNLAHVLEGRASLEDILIPGPAGIRIVPGASGLARMADLPEVQRARLLEALDDLGARADLIVTDTSAGIGRGVIDLVSHADDAIVVTTPEPTAVTDAYAVIKLLAAECGKGPGPRMHLVVNLVGHMLDGSRVARRLDEVARQFLGRPLNHLGTILGDPAVGHAVAARTPVLTKYPNSPASACLRKVAQRLLAQMTRPEVRLVPRVMKKSA
jgi:flagellar biosynthesis protein FlhG